MAWHFTVSKQMSAISFVTSTIVVWTPVGAIFFLMSLMSFSSGWPTFALNALTLTPASLRTQQIVFESSPPETQTPTVFPLRSASFIVLSLLLKFDVILYHNFATAAHPKRNRPFAGEASGDRAAGLSATSTLIQPLHNRFPTPRQPSGTSTNLHPSFNRHATASQSQQRLICLTITFQPPESAKRTIPRLANTHDSTILRAEYKSYSRSRIPCHAKYTQPYTLRPFFLQTYTSRIRPSGKARVREINVLWVKARTGTETLIGYGTPTVITLNGCPDERSWFVIATK